MIVVGVGVEPGITPEVLTRAVDEALVGSPGPLVVATMDKRAVERAVLVLAQSRAEGREPLTFTPPELDEVEVPNPSALVRRLTGTGSVAEAAAILGARHLGGAGRLVVEKRKGDGVTVALAR